MAIQFPHQYLLWWLILCVNLTRLREAQTDGKTRFWSVSVRVFLEEISILFSRLKDPSSVVGIIQYHWGPKQNKKVKEEWILSLSLILHEFRDIYLFLPSGRGAPGFWAFGLLRCMYRRDPLALILWMNYITGIPVFPAFRQSRLWDLTSTTTYANAYNKSPLISIYIYPIGSSSLKNFNNFLTV